MLVKRHLTLDFFRGAEDVIINVKGRNYFDKQRKKGKNYL